MNLIPALRRMPPSDVRDWTAIRTWASGLAGEPATGALTGHLATFCCVNLCTSLPSSAAHRKKGNTARIVQMIATELQTLAACSRAAATV